MKTVKFLSLIMAIGFFSFVITSCDKDKLDKDFDSSSMQQLVQDEVNMESTSNDALDDANEVLSKGGSLKATDALPCNCVIDSVLSGDTMTYTLTFNGNNCNNTKSKTGQIKIKRVVTAAWSAAGTTVSLQFINYKVTKLSNQKWTMLNGTKTWTNLSGGLIKNLGSGTTTSVVHTITGSLQASFSDTTTRTWNVARKKTFTGSYPNALILSIEGTGNANGYNNLATWGTNRHNEAFYTQINQAIVLKQSCNWDPTSGIKVHQVPADNKTATATFGFDANNQLITNGDCPEKYKVEWVRGNLSGSTFLNLH